MTNFQSLNSIESIKQYFEANNGLQLSNRYFVSIKGLPTVVSSTGTFSIQAESVDWGPRALYFVQDNLTGYGGGRFVPRSQEILAAGANGLMISFPVTNNNYILDIMNRWFNYFYPSALNRVDTQRGAWVLPYYDTAVAPVTMGISLLNPNGEANSLTKFYEVFPIDTQPIFLTMAKSDSYMRYSATFGFRDYEMIFNNPPVSV